MSSPRKSVAFVIPEQTAKVASAAFPDGSPYIVLREQVGTVFVEDDFVDPHPARGRPGYPARRLALVTLLQF